MSKTPTFIEKVRKKLLARKDAILAQLAGASAPSPENKQVRDIGDEALSASMDKLQNSLEQAEIDEINLIDAAMGRIERGEYGICLDCGDEVSDRRLEHSPFAARCIVCQEELENAQG